MGRKLGCHCCGQVTPLPRFSKLYLVPDACHNRRRQHCFYPGGGAGHAPTVGVLGEVRACVWSEPALAHAALAAALLLTLVQMLVPCTIFHFAFLCPADGARPALPMPMYARTMLQQLPCSALSASVQGAVARHAAVVWADRLWLRWRRHPARLCFQVRRVVSCAPASLTPLPLRACGRRVFRGGRKVRVPVFLVLFAVVLAALATWRLSVH